MSQLEETEKLREEEESPAPSSEPWHRQDDESAQAHGAFQAYLDLGEGRTLKAVAHQRGCHISLLKRWSSRYHWRERAYAWEERQRRRAGSETRTQEAAYGRRSRYAEQLEKVAMAGLRSLLVQDGETGELRFDQRLKPVDIASLIRVACQLLPTPPAALEVESPESGLGHLSEAELRHLEALLTHETREERTDEPVESKG